MLLEFNLNEIETYITIDLQLIPKTYINEYDYPIFFIIKIDPVHYSIEPIILCKTNFIFPSLFNNKNLFSCLVNEWNPTINGLYNSTINIILNILNFLKIYKYSINKQLFCKISDYSLNSNYCINDFLLNDNTILAKIIIDLKDSHKNLYMIINDFELIIFLPNEGTNLNHMVKIIYHICLNDLNYFKVQEELNNDIKFYLTVKEDSGIRQFGNLITMKKNKFKEICECVHNNQKLFEKFKFILPIHLNKNNINSFDKRIINDAEELIKDLKHEINGNTNENIYCLKEIEILQQFIYNVNNFKK